MANSTFIAVYSLLSMKAIKCEIVKYSDDCIVVTSDKFDQLKDSIGIPVVVGKTVDGTTTTYSGYISEITKEGVKIDLTIPKDYHFNKRSKPRLYASLEADIITKDRVRQRCYIKDISINGLRLLTKESHREGQIINFDLYCTVGVKGLSGIVRWSRYSYKMGMYEEGIDMTYKDQASLLFLQDVMKALENKYTDIFGNA